MRRRKSCRAGRVDFELALALRRGRFLQRPADQESLGAADPVLLHGADLFRPFGQPVERIEQVLGEIGDLEEPLRQFALLDRRARAPAAPVDDLLVGEHRHVLGIPVHLGSLARDQSLVEEIQEQHLLAVIIVDVAGRELPAPVDRQSHHLELRAHGGDVCVGPVAGVDPVLHRRVLGRHAEGVPAHRMQDVEALRALVAGHHVAHRIVARVADVDAAGRIGEHLQHVIFRARVVVPRLEELCRVPGLLPSGFGGARIVSFGCHDRIFT